MTKRETEPATGGGLGGGITLGTKDRWSAMLPTGVDAARKPSRSYPSMTFPLGSWRAVIRSLLTRTSTTPPGAPRTPILSSQR
jgi:hypothetical protein